MMRQLILFSVDVTEAYDQMNLSKVYSLVKDFCKEVQKEYLPFARERLYSCDVTDPKYLSTQHVYY